MKLMHPRDITILLVLATVGIGMIVAPATKMPPQKTIVKTFCTTKITFAE